ncbi:MAG: T9SS type A sorting domain-containing protein [Bacteroidetes bacterium]|nr:T9SS type A sorting domain-containing protein [Bacteroidota bacterium]
METVMEENISFFPNPATEVLNINIVDITVNNITILDLSGKVLIIIENTNTGTKTIDVSALTSGMYIIRFETDETIINERFIISK